MSESFILSSKVDEKLCDLLREQFDGPEPPEVRGNAVIEKRGYDRAREYHRMSSTKLDPIIRHAYESAITASLQEYYDTYYWCEKWSTEIEIWPWNIQKYNAGHAYRNWHIEDSGPCDGKPLRKLVFMTYLNTVTDGGETEFMSQGLKFMPRKGLTLIWPAIWTHPHRGVVSPTQTKYIATGWWMYKDSVQSRK